MKDISVLGTFSDELNTSVTQNRARRRTEQREENLVNEPILNTPEEECDSKTGSKERSDSAVAASRNFRNKVANNSNLVHHRRRKEAGI